MLFSETAGLYASFGPALADRLLLVSEPFHLQIEERVVEQVVRPAAPLPRPSHTGLVVLPHDPMDGGPCAALPMVDSVVDLATGLGDRFDVLEHRVREGHVAGLGALLGLMTDEQDDADAREFEAEKAMAALEELTPGLRAVIDQAVEPHEAGWRWGELRPGVARETLEDLAALVARARILTARYERVLREPGALYLGGFWFDAFNLIGMLSTQLRPALHEAAYRALVTDVVEVLALTYDHPADITLSAFEALKSLVAPSSAEADMALHYALAIDTAYGDAMRNVLAADGKTQ